MHPSVVDRSSFVDRASTLTEATLERPHPSFMMRDYSEPPSPSYMNRDSSFSEPPTPTFFRNSTFSEAKSDRPLLNSRRQSPEPGEPAAPEQLHPASRRSLARSIAIVAACTGVTVVNTLNAISVSISLPDIGRSIAMQEAQLQWLLSAYSLSSGCLLLLFGRLADMYGRKRTFLFGMFWQAVFALGLGFSNDGITLDILRGFQGLGAAASIPAAVGILAHSFPPSRARSIAFSTFTAGAPIGGAFGTIIGGVLTQLSTEHWRSPFFLSAGLSTLCVLGGLAVFDADDISPDVDRRIDWIGAILVTGGLVLVVFVLGQGAVASWSTPYIIACLVVGVVLLVVFIVWEHHLEKSVTNPNKPQSFWAPPPLMRPSIWARAKGRMSVILIVAFLTWSGFVSWSFWVQLYYQNYLQLTPVHSMLYFIPMFITGCFCNVFIALVIAKVSLVALIVLGTLLTGSACVLFALINPTTTYWAYAFPSTIMVVFGADFVLSAGTIFVAKIAAPEEQSLAGGLFQTMSRVGTSIGLTATTIVFNSVVETQSSQLGVVVNSSGSNAPPSAQLQGYRAAQWTSAAFPLFACLLAAVLLRKVGVVGDNRPAQHELVSQSDASSQTMTQVDSRP